MNTMTMVPTTPPATHSLWHSPVPYLFGGLAAMLGLIAFALLILACSYWRLSNHLNQNSDEVDVERGEKTCNEKPKFPVQLEEKIVVIMAGQDTPTFLATPVSSRGSSFKSECFDKEIAGKVDGDREREKEESTDQIELGSIERHEISG